MSEDNGGSSKRPFGPHGEGCQCDEHGGETTPEDDGETTPEAPAIFVSVGYNPESLNELLFRGISDAYAAHFQGAIEQCMYDGDPLSANQIKHLIGSLMGGHALARSAAEQIQLAYVQLVREKYLSKTAAPESAEEPKDEEKPEGHGLNDINQLFEGGGPSAN